MSQPAGADTAHRRTRLVRRLSAGLVTGAVALSGGLAAAVLGDDVASGVSVSDPGPDSGSSTDPGSTDSPSSDTPVTLGPGSGDDHATTSGS